MSQPTSTKQKASRVVSDAVSHDHGLLQNEIALENPSGVLEGHLKDPGAAEIPTSGIDETAYAADVDIVEPVAYDTIPPLKATLTFDSVEGFGDWHILISTRAFQDLRNARRREPRLFVTYVKKMRELSRGYFSDDNYIKLAGDDDDIPLYEANITGDNRLVYLIDCIREFGDSTERQVIKIFGIYTHAHLKRDVQVWYNVSKQLSGRGNEYRTRCLARVKPANTGHNMPVFSPATFPPNIEREDVNLSANLQHLHLYEQQDLHERLVLEKFYPFSQVVLNSILAEEDVAHVFHMSPTQQDIVSYVGSCYVHGRSGTGKTTTMIFKMLGIERAHQTACAEYSAGALCPRQLFVTRSRVLAEKIQGYYAKLALGQAAGRRTARESTNLATTYHNQENLGFIEEDKQHFHHGALVPRSFSALTDEHFPLFITFDHLCQLLEADQTDSRQSVADSLGQSNNSTLYLPQSPKTFVSYSKFYSEYWCHFPWNLTKNLDPALVFAEILGVIKGSEKGFLDRNTYINLSHRSRATFATRRDTVYSLFQAYTKRKQQRQEWDAADRSHSIIRGLHEFGVPGRKIDYIYIDEAQDNLLIDALILQAVCNNPSGLTWAWDATRAISSRNSSRLEGLKALLSRVEKPLPPNPVDFKLTINHRFRGGLIRAAYSIVQLVLTFWPHAIDALDEDKGAIGGGKPIFFINQEQDSCRYEQYLFGTPGSQIEYGANQCILVRDDAARDELRKQVGDVGKVITLYESKDLEFNDVLLYNFFHDSTVEVSQWRAILNALPGKKGIRCSVFDETRYNGVLKELELLYTAITRARQNLWIADSSAKCEPLRLFWEKQGLAESIPVSDEIMPYLAIMSTQQDWAETGKLLFETKQFSQASHAFAMAGLLHQKGIATAYYLREMAQHTPQSLNTASDLRHQVFLEAAEAFSLCANMTSSANAKQSYYRSSAQCYINAAEIKKAGEMYLLAGEPTEATKVFRQGEFSDEAGDDLEKYTERIELADVEKVRGVTMIH